MSNHEDERQPDTHVHVRTILQTIKGLEEARDSWVEALNKNPAHLEAGARIYRISAQIDALDNLLRGAYAFRGINI